jgi:tetrahydromethanopterin S-methyltransferase subunit B
MKYYTKIKVMLRSDELKIDKGIDELSTVMDDIRRSLKKIKESKNYFGNFVYILVDFISNIFFLFKTGCWINHRKNILITLKRCRKALHNRKIAKSRLTRTFENLENFKSNEFLCQKVWKEMSEIRNDN